MDLDFSKYTDPTGRDCPFCGEELLSSKDGFGNFAAVCLNPECPKHYRSPDGAKTTYYCEMRPGSNTPSDTQSKLLEDARKYEAHGYYAKYSLFSNRVMRQKDLNNFRRDTPQQNGAFGIAVTAANRIAKKQPTHVFFFGKPGTGKSHLANGIVISTMKLSGYRLRCFFLDWREYIDLTKKAIADPSIAKQVAGIQAQFAKADLIVLDDLGSERATSSGYAIDLADTISRKFENKSLVITSNLSAPGLRKLYGERMYSRLMTNSNGLSFQFNNMADYRSQNAAQQPQASQGMF